MITFLYISLAFSLGFTLGLVWSFCGGDAISEIVGERLNPLQRAQINAAVIWCGTKGLARAVWAQGKLWLAKLMNRI